MTTQNTPVTRASDYSETAEWRRLDPLTAETMARFARQEMIAKFLRAAWKSVTEAIAKQFRSRTVYQELSELPDYLLNDIGVRRDQVSAIAYGGLTRPATDLELATGHGSLSFFEHRPAAVAASSEATTSGADKPLAA